MEIKPVKPNIYYNPLFGLSNSLLLLCEEYKLDIEKNFVHLSWIIYQNNQKEIGNIILLLLLDNRL